jgi:hypothetical protein
VPYSKKDGIHREQLPVQAIPLAEKQERYSRYLKMPENARGLGRLQRTGIHVAAGLSIAAGTDQSEQTVGLNSGVDA